MSVDLRRVGSLMLLLMLWQAVAITADSPLLPDPVAVVRGAGPSFLTLTNYQVPVWAVIFGLVFLGEALPPPFFGALGLILAGLWVSRGRARTGVV